MKRYQVYYNDKANMNEVCNASFDTLEEAIKEANSYVKGKDLCDGEPFTDSCPSFYMSVYDTTKDPEKDEHFGIIYQTPWYWGEK